MNALEKITSLSEDRCARARELTASGSRTIGYICLFPPIELVTAAGLVPFRITGSQKPIVKADEYLETLMCPFVRSCFDLALDKKFDFLSGMIWPHSCDSVQKTYDIWKHYAPSDMFHYFDVPHMTGQTSREFFMTELEKLKSSLEKLAGSEITDEKIRQAIRDHNRNRALLKELSGLRKSDPPLLSGAEMMRAMLASTALPIEESNRLLEDLIAEIKSRPNPPLSSGPRLLLYGSEIDNVELLELLEGAGANVVIDDLCMGSKYWLKGVDEDGDPLAALARHYLEDLTCPRTFRFAKTREQDLENRFGYVRDLAREYNVSGAVLYVLMFCDTFEFDAPDARDFLESAGVPCLHLEDDYRLSAKSAIQNRVQAFIEMISSKDANPGGASGE